MTDILAITAVYGQSHLRYLPAFLESLFTHKHTEVIIATDGERYDDIDRLMAWSTHVKDFSVTVVSCADDPMFRRVAQGASPGVAKIAAWQRAVRLTATGRKFVCLDVDSLVVQPLGNAFEQASQRPFNLAVPRSLHASGRYTYRPSLVAGIGTSVIAREFDAWLRETLRLAGLERRTVADLYGSPQAGALEVLASKAEESGQTLVAYLPGKTWAAEVPPFEGAGVVHFRSSAVPPRDDPSWAAITTDWHWARERYFQRLGVSVPRERVAL